MSTATVEELRTNLNDYLERVKAGDDVVITQNGVPIARLTAADAEVERLLRLERDGRIRLGSGAVPADFWAIPRPADPEDRLRKAVLEERDEGW